MEKIAAAIGALLAFLIPVGFYCLLLATINRRTKPLIASGLWDAVGLLAAMSGFALWTLPFLFQECCERVFGIVEGTYLYAFAWPIYAVLLIGVSALLLFVRVHKTIIYNVDVALFNKLFEHALANLGFEGKTVRDRTVVVPATPAVELTAIAEQPANRPKDQRLAEVRLELFSAMSHVTIHWDRCSPGLRGDIERELDKQLELAAPEENPAAGWFYSISGLIIGALLMVALTILLVLFVPRR